MSNVIFFVASSLDGFIADEDGGIDWLFSDQDYGYKSFYDGIGTVIQGRKTYEKVLSFGIDYPYADKRNYVFTKDISLSSDKNVRFVSKEHKERIVDLKNSEEKNIWLVGGGELCEWFLNEGLLDEIIVSIHPILLGKGIPLFGEKIKQTKLEASNIKQYDTGLIQIKYLVSGST